LKDFVKKIVPFELRRGASVIGIIVALVVTGILTNLGDLILTSIVEVLGGGFQLLEKGF
jgi:hypothetical protein